MCHLFVGIVHPSLLPIIEAFGEHHRGSSGLWHILVQALKLASFIDGPDGGPCLFKDILSFLDPDDAQALSVAESHMAEKKILSKAAFQTKVACQVHLKQCKPIESDLDLSGPHCNEHSAAGNRAGRHGVTSKFFLTHTQRLKERRVPIAILENVLTGEFGELVWGAQMESMSKPSMKRLCSGIVFVYLSLHIPYIYIYKKHICMHIYI